jgi:hypothetical protein
VLPPTKTTGAKVSLHEFLEKKSNVSYKKEKSNNNRVVCEELYPSF